MYRLSSVVIIFLLFLSFARATEISSFSELDSLPVRTPSLVVPCFNELWVYSKEDRTFYSFMNRTKTSKTLRVSEAGGSLTAAECFNNQLILGFSNKKQSSFFKAYSLSNDKLVPSPQVLKSLGPGHISDLKCNDKKCLAVFSGKVFETNDLIHWLHIPVRSTKNIKNIEVDTSTNPFDGWQDKLLLTEGQITQIIILQNNEFIVLDSLRASVIHRKPGGDLERWGKWGAWEGHFLSPKAFSLVESKYLFIVDPVLKVISIFTLSGNFVSLLGTAGQLPDFGYPSRIVYFDKSIYVSDMFANKVRVFKVPDLLNLKDAKADFVRTNLFRRTEVLKDRISNRCLLCHDGTLADDSDKYLHPQTNHPIGIIETQKIDLGLTEGNLVTCSTCHNPHHEKAPPHLQKKPLELCTTCHKAQLVKNSNHDDKKGNNCLTCHTPHNGVQGVLKKTPTQLCLTCHSKQKFEHRSIAHLLSTERAKGVHVSNKEVSCLTCHAPHGISEKKYLRPRAELTAFCASCHGEKSETLFMNFHKRMIGK